MKASFRNIWSIRKNTNWSIVWFMFSSIFFIKSKNCSLLEVCYNISLSYSVINAFVYKLGEETKVFLYYLVLLFYILRVLINLLIWFFVTNWNVKVSSEVVTCLLIQVILRWFLHLSIIFSKGSSEVFVLLKSLLSLFILILRIIFRKY